MSEYTEKANLFLEESETTIEIKRVGSVDGFPNSDDTLPHGKYSVTLKRNGKEFEFKFYGSYRDFINHTDPTAYDVLACLQNYEPEKNMWDFANEFGYTINSEETYQRVKKIWHGCWKEYRGLKSLYEPEWLERLGEIC